VIDDDPGLAELDPKYPPGYLADDLGRCGTISADENPHGS
jgi:hypothetical protein